MLRLSQGVSPAQEVVSPGAAIAAVSSLMEQLAQSREEQESLAGQLEEVSSQSLLYITRKCYSIGRAKASST